MHGNNTIRKLNGEYPVKLTRLAKAKILIGWLKYKVTDSVPISMFLIYVAVFSLVGLTHLIWG